VLSRETGREQILVQDIPQNSGVAPESGNIWGVLYGEHAPRLVSFGQPALILLGV
jgi:hypothetical protein